MKFSIYSVLLLAVSHSVYSKNTVSALDSADQSQTTILAKAFAPKLPYSGGGGSTVHYFEDNQIGYFIPIASAPKGVSYKGGFMFKLEMGAKIEMQSRNSNRLGLLGFSGFYSMFGAKNNYLDLAGKEQTTKFTLTTIGVPITYTSMSSPEGRGHYWQFGASFSFIHQAETGGRDISKYYATFYVEPMVSAGWCFPYELKWTRESFSSGMALVGPFAAYSASNLSKSTGTSLHGLTVGIKYTYVFM